MTADLKTLTNMLRNFSWFHGNKTKGRSTLAFSRPTSHDAVNH